MKFAATSIAGAACASHRLGRDRNYTTAARALAPSRVYRCAALFLQLEAVETIIWLTEVAPKRAASKGLLDQIAKANEEANPALFRLAMKMATGSGKTTVMAMLIAWQAVNAARKDSKDFSRAFLIITPGITIKDRLRVLQPSDENNYYETRELVPPDMLPDIRRVELVITNYHAFQHREKLALQRSQGASFRAMTRPQSRRPRPTPKCWSELAASCSPTPGSTCSMTKLTIATGTRSATIPKAC